MSTVQDAIKVIMEKNSRVLPSLKKEMKSLIDDAVIRAAGALGSKREGGMNSNECIREIQICVLKQMEMEKLEALRIVYKESASEYLPFKLKEKYYGPDSWTYANCVEVLLLLQDWEPL